MEKYLLLAQYSSAAELLTTSFETPGEGEEGVNSSRISTGFLKGKILIFELMSKNANKCNFFSVS